MAFVSATYSKSPEVKQLLGLFTGNSELIANLLIFYIHPEKLITLYEVD